MNQKRHRKFRSLYVWHRYAGITAALFTLVLSFTGLALNHTNGLKLDSRFVESEWLLNWYEIQAPDDIQAYDLGQQWLVHIGERLYLDQHHIANSHKNPIGVLKFPHFLAVAIQHEILLITRDGEIIEKLHGTHGVPSGMKRIGMLADHTIIIEAAHGYYQTNRDFLEWRETKQVGDVAWSKASSLPEPIRKATRERYRGNELPMERVILDLHSGRLFGGWGPFVMDITAILLVFLAATGTTLWLKQLLRRRQRKTPKHPA